MALPKRKSTGQISVAHRPRWTFIGRILTKNGPVFLLLLVPPLIVALLEGKIRLVIALATPALFTLVLFIVRGRIELPTNIRRIEAVVSVAMVFVLGVILTWPAYLALGLDPIDALFEATSALTTTGFSMIITPEDLPVSGHFLRAWSQWCGGLVIAIAGLAFLMGSGPAAKVLGFVDFAEEHMESSSRRHAQALIWTYLSITVFGVVGAAILIPASLDGPLLVLSAVSTGGMAPRSDSLASYSAPAQAFLVLLGTVGAVTLAFPVLAKRHSLASALQASNLPSFGKTVLIALCAYMLINILSGTHSPGAVWTGLLTLLSLQSTTGFTVEPVAGPPPFLILLVVLMAIGGQTGSTAGGLKIERIRVLLNTVSLTLRQLLSPAKAVHFLRLDGEILEPDRMAFALSLFVSYVATVLLLWIAFTLCGLPAMSSLFDIVSALSTVGAGTGVIGPDLALGLKVLTVLAMLLGRIEFFGLLVLAHPRTWKRKD
jgi:trk system potassium uptake protein TrkH